MKTEQAKQLTNDALERLAQALEAGQSDTMQNFLRAMSHFHSYSVGNLFLILAQRPDATHVAGFRAWKKLGRFVRRGEKGIAIVAPMRIKPKDDRARRREHHPVPDSAEGESFLRFRIAYVFDVSQTQGDPLPEFARVTGNPGVYLTRLHAFAESRGIGVCYEHIPGSADGYSCGGKIVVQEGLSSSATFSILAHELAHEFLHQGGRDDRPSKTVRETEAEAVAFVVCQAIGLECGTASSDYIQLYRGDAETLSSSLARIQRTSAEMIAAIEDAAEKEEASRKAAYCKAAADSLWHASPMFATPWQGIRWFDGEAARIMPTMQITFTVSGVPPKKDGANSMWGKPSELARLQALRVAAHAALAGQVFREGPVELTLRIRAAIRAGDLDNFITGVCDGLMAADPRSKTDPAAWFDLPEAVRPDRPVAYVDDACISRIVAERSPPNADGPSYEVKLCG